MFRYTGEYKKHTTDGRHKMDFYTFTPSPLCGGLSLSVDDELLALLTTAHRLLGILEGMTALSAERKIIEEVFRLKESYYSLLMDGENIDTFRIVLKARAAKRDMQTIENVASAQRHSFGKPVTNTELSKICSLAIYGVKSPQTVEIRSKQIYFRKALTNLKIYTPTAPEDIMPALNDLTEFIHIDNHTDIIIKATLAHYQFDMIHPFEKRNGVVGRILTPMILFGAQYHAASYLCISEFLYHNRGEYLDKLSSTQQGNGYSYWIKFFIKAICYAADRSINRISRFTEIITDDARQVAKLEKSSRHVTPVYDYFKKHLVSDIKPIAEETGISYNTAAKVVGLMTDTGLLKLERSQLRHKVYCHRALEVFEA